LGLSLSLFVNLIYCEDLAQSFSCKHTDCLRRVINEIQ
jgi:hypothetical protein